MPVFSIPLSGLNSASAALSTIANNLANLNTVGYKDQSTLFKDLFYQTVGSTGGGDPIQTGAGSAVDEITSNFNSGSVETTGVNTDVAIGGDGFFVVDNDGVQSYTRAGNFSTSPDGTLTTSDGATVMGYPAVNGQISQQAGLSSINVGSGYTSPPNPTSNIQLTANLDANANVGDSYPTSISVYDSLGQSHVLTANFTKTGQNSWNYNITVPGSDVGSPNATVPVGSGSLTFDGNGNLVTPSSDVSGLNISGFSDGASPLSFGWQLFNGSGSLLTQVASPNSTAATNQDGYASGNLQTFAINNDGTIEGTFSNGKSLALGQLVLANFPNDQGLVRQGANNYQPSLASGEAVIGTPGTGGRGTLSGGALELSNVDIATEFSQLITAQRGFEANARTITTFDQVMQDTIDLKH
jgi:flagellar hook protein FlgE